MVVTSNRFGIVGPVLLEHIMGIRMVPPEEGVSEMVGFVLTGHGDFAPGLASSVEMIAGPQPDFDTVAFHEDAAGEYPRLLAAAITGALERCGSAVVFCDLMGGTPFNQAMLVSQARPGVEVVVGTNLPMLLEALMGRGDMSTAAGLADEAVSAGMTSIAHARLDVDEDADDDELFDADGI